MRRKRCKDDVKIELPRTIAKPRGLELGMVAQEAGAGLVSQQLCTFDSTVLRISRQRRTISIIHVLTPCRQDSSLLIKCMSLGESHTQDALSR